MTDESKKDTEPWVESKRARYPYGYDKGGKLKRYFGVTGIPAAVLIDPTGTVVWRGHPGGLTKSEIEKHLAGALETPVFRWPAAASKARQAFQKRQVAKALEEAKALGAEGEAIAASLERLVASRLAALEAAAQAKDWLAAEERGKAMQKELAGLPAAERVKELLERLDGDPAAKACVAAQKEVRKLLDGKIKKNDKPRIEKALKQILAEHPGTGAARDAEQALLELRRR